MVNRKTANSSAFIETSEQDVHKFFKLNEVNNNNNNQSNESRNQLNEREQNLISNNEENKIKEEHKKEINEIKKINKSIYKWIKENAKLTKPNKIRLINGTEEEKKELLEMMELQGTILKLNENKYENCYAAFSDESDVARVEKQTFICCDKEEDAGPTNNWRNPEEMMTLLNGLMDGAMKGRTMYVMFFTMAPAGSPFAMYAVQITDSPYVVVNMQIMTRILPFSEWEKNRVKGGKEEIRCVHSVGAPLEEGEADVEWPCNKKEKYIVHFPDQKKIYSYGSGYGGNALLGKKCLALRIASALGKQEGWLAEHMLILSITNPLGEKKYMAAAFPSACGKTNLAMLLPTIDGWKVETIGDDIAWIRPGKDGRLYACNPENGFFGVAPGTSNRNNPIAMKTINRNTLFTNVAITDDRSVWWEGLSDLPNSLTTWQLVHLPSTSSSPLPQPYAHPNGRFTAPIKQCPIIDENWENGEGVPLSAIIFGGRRKTTIPLVRESFNWSHGVFLGSIISSEQTAAAEGTVGALRHDPFAMIPFCGYNMADYFNHWINLPRVFSDSNVLCDSAALSSQLLLPKIFYVNWFRCDSDGSFLWPGFGENGRVLKWIFERTSGKIGAEETAIGLLPKAGDLDLPPSVNDQAFKKLFEINDEEWKKEVASISNFMAQFKEKLPPSLLNHITNLSDHFNHNNNVNVNNIQKANCK